MIYLKCKKRLNGFNGNFTLNIEIGVEKYEFVAIAGESGAGKTSILKMLAGFMMPDEGYIEVDGNVWFDSQKKIHRPAQKRSIGYLFQDYALFPNMTVFENLKYAMGRNYDKKMIDYYLNNFHLKHLKDSSPDKLSGGQKQRVAIIRTLIRKPNILLLDEPFSSLDKDTKTAIQDEIASLHKKLQLTTVLVSHNTSEVYKLCTRLITLEAGIVKKEITLADTMKNYTQSGIVIDSKKLKEINNDIVVHISDAFLKIPTQMIKNNNAEINNNIKLSIKLFKNV